MVKKVFIWASFSQRFDQIVKVLRKVQEECVWLAASDDPRHPVGGNPQVRRNSKDLNEPQYRAPFTWARTPSGLDRIVIQNWNVRD